jgi:hypothetical protein
MKLDDDDFTLFGLAPRFGIDRQEVDVRWRALQAQATLELCLAWFARYREVVAAAQPQHSKAKHYRRRWPADSQMAPERSLAGAVQPAAGCGQPALSGLCPLARPALCAAGAARAPTIPLAPGSPPAMSAFTDERDLDHPVSAEVEQTIRSVLEEHLTSQGLEGVLLNLGLDHDGDPVLFVHLKFRVVEPAINPRLLSNCTVSLRRSLWEMVELLSASPLRLPRRPADPGHGELVSGSLQ